MRLLKKICCHRYFASSRRERVNLHCTMVTVSDEAKAQCILWMHETQSPMKVMREFRLRYSKNNHWKVPSRTTIRRWYSNFLKTGHVMSQAKKGRKSVDQHIVERLERIFKEHPRISIRVAAQQVPVCIGTVHKIVRKQSKFFPYKIQTIQALKPTDYEKRQEFAQTILARMNRDPDYLNNIFLPMKRHSILQDALIGILSVSGGKRIHS